MTAIELHGLQYSYPRTVALRCVWLSVAEGETVAVTGPSGVRAQREYLLAHRHRGEPARR